MAPADELAVHRDLELSPAAPEDLVKAVEAKATAQAEAKDITFAQATLQAAALGFGIPDQPSCS